MPTWLIWTLVSYFAVGFVVAGRLFPRLESHFSRVKDDGRAEALLIAVYYATQFKGQETSK